jgi:ectoine hydroxylase-related dioxygenase (phytanoyl-CoA dioxygenase family)
MDAARDALGRDGFASLGRVLEPAELEPLRAAASAHLVERGARSDVGEIAMDLARHAPACAALLPRLAAPVRALLGEPEVVLFHDLVFDKRLGRAPLTWHRDAAHLPLDDDDGLILWVALDEASEADGCLRYLAGSQTSTEGGAYDPARTAPPVPGAVVPAPIAAGEALVHSLRVWHDSPASVTGRHRRGWSLCWVRPRARWAPERAGHPFVLELSPVAGEELAKERFPRF